MHPLTPCTHADTRAARRLDDALHDDVDEDALLRADHAQCQRSERVWHRRLSTAAKAVVQGIRRRSVVRNSFLVLPSTQASSGGTVVAHQKVPDISPAQKTHPDDVQKSAAARRSRFLSLQPRNRGLSMLRSRTPARKSDSDDSLPGMNFSQQAGTALPERLPPSTERMPSQTARQRSRKESRHGTHDAHRRMPPLREVISRNSDVFKKAKHVRL